MLPITKNIVPIERSHFLMELARKRFGKKFIKSTIKSESRISPLPKSLFSYFEGIIYLIIGVITYLFNPDLWIVSIGLLSIGLMIILIIKKEKDLELFGSANLRAIVSNYKKEEIIELKNSFLLKNSEQSKLILNDILAKID